MMDRERVAILGLAMACMLALGACANSAEVPSESDTTAGVPATAGLPEGHPQVPTGSQASLPSGGPVGIVLETVVSGGYTYSRLESQGEEIWAAGPQTTLSVGDTVLLAGGMAMTDFTSSTLDRTFESLLFLNAYQKPTPSAASTGTRGKVLETMDSAGYTYVHVEMDGEKLWLAGPLTVVEVGQTVAWIAGPVMQDFQSPSLGRTFDALVFAGAIEVVE